MKTLALLIALAVAAPAQAQSPGDWTPLFDGETTDGWKHVGEGTFALEDSLLKTKGGMGLLWYAPRKIGNAQIRVVYRTEEASSNSGVFIRIPERPAEPWMPVHRGYEVQINDAADSSHTTGVLYSLTEAKARPGRPAEWSTMTITLDGPRTAVRVNGTKVTDYTEGDPVLKREHEWEPERGPRPERGYIGLQNHGDGDTVWFREVSVRPLSDSEDND
jgi:hypothetical protein